MNKTKAAINQSNISGSYAYFFVTLHVLALISMSGKQQDRGLIVACFVVNFLSPRQRE